MNRKMLVSTCLLAVGLTAPLALHAAILQDPPPQDAQAAPAGNELPTNMIDVLSQKLALSDDQKNQIEPILTDRRAKLTALMQDTSMRRFQRMRQAKKIMEDSDKKINPILTPDQQKKYAELEQQMRDKMRERMQQGQGGTN
jgi:periplasmic protein CpxP/Spy